MFDENASHLQIPLTSTIDELTKKQRKRLDSSWASVFYREFFCRFKEESFAVLPLNGAVGATNAILARSLLITAINESNSCKILSLLYLSIFINTLTDCLYHTTWSG